MNINNEEIKIKNINAYYDNRIELEAENGICLIINFKATPSELKDINLNERLLITDKFYFDASIEKDKENYMCFDISNNEIYLTKIDDNMYRLEIIIDDISIINKLGTIDINNIKVDTTITFDYEYKDLPNYEILNKKTKSHTQEELNSILDKM